MLKTKNLKVKQFNCSKNQKVFISFVFVSE